MLDGHPPQRFITRYPFAKDKSRPGRTLQSVKVGGVYISRLVVDPGKVVGNVYFKKTNLIFFVEVGNVEMTCIQMSTKETEVALVGPGDGIIHVPPYVAFAFKNIQPQEVVMIMFSNRPLRGDDEYDYSIYSD